MRMFRLNYLDLGCQKWCNELHNLVCIRVEDMCNQYCVEHDKYPCKLGTIFPAIDSEAQPYMPYESGSK